MYNFPWRNPVTDTATGAGLLVATVPGVADKITYGLKVIGYTDLAGVVNIASTGKDTITVRVAANEAFNIDLHGWYQSVSYNTSITASVTTTSAGSISIIGEAI